MADLIDSIWEKSDKLQVTIFTRSFRFDGFLHTPKIGKETRRLSDTLNTDRNFITLTNVTVTNLTTGTQDATVHLMLQVSLSAIEFINPHIKQGD